MNRTLFTLIACCLFLAPVFAKDRALTGQRGIPIVTDPRDLSLVDLQPLTKYLNSDLRNKGVFGPIRRLALDYKAKKSGVPDARSADLRGGFVIARGKGGQNSAVLVLAGSIDVKRLAPTIEKDYREYMEKTGGGVTVNDASVAGVAARTLGFSERDLDTWIVPLPTRKILVIALVPRDDMSILEDTVKVVEGKTPLNAAVIKDVEVQTSFSLTPREVSRLISFNRPKGELRKKFAAGMKNVSKSLGVAHAEDDMIPLEERIRGLVVKSSGIEAKYRFDIDGRKASAYHMTYEISMKESEDATALKDLMAEQMTRLAEKSPAEAERDALGRLTVEQVGDAVRLTFLLDSPEAQYQHLSLLVGQMFRYKGLMSSIDRHAPATN